MSIRKQIMLGIFAMVPVCCASALDLAAAGPAAAGYRAGADGASQRGRGTAPVPATYEDFSGATLNLYAWEGRHTAFLTSRSDLSRAAMASLLRTTDRTYLYYRQATGYTPTPAKTFNGKSTIAEVPATCGAGCGYLGATGIELQTDYFDALYRGVLANNTYEQIVFYEFGRNFWHLSDQLAYQPPDSPDAVVAGFAVFMRFMAARATGVRMSDFNGWSAAEFRARVKAMVDLYAADPTQTWDNTLRLNRAQADNPSNLNGPDLFASFLFRLARDHGGDAFVARLWREAAKRPAATSTQDAVDNFFLAACAAARRNLTTLFTVQWRWPVSATAQAAAMRYPA